MVILFDMLLYPHGFPLLNFKLGDHSMANISRDIWIEFDEFLGQAKSSESFYFIDCVVLHFDPV